MLLCALAAEGIGCAMMVSLESTNTSTMGGDRAKILAGCVLVTRSLPE